MSRQQAIEELYFNAAGERRSQAALDRIRRACRTLEFSKEETELFEALCEYRYHVHGELYPAYK